MRRAAIVAGMLAGLGLAGLAVEPAAAQTRVVVPIVVPVPRPAPARAATPSSVHVTTRTTSPQPGVTTTRITVRDTSGANRSLSLPPTARSLVTVPTGTTSLRVTTRTESPQPGVTTTRITVRDTSGANRSLSVSPTTRTLVTVPAGTSSLLVTVAEASGPGGPGAPDRTRVTIEDVSRAGRVAGGALPTSSLRAAGSGQQTVTITSEAPIDTPIVILSD